MTPRWFLGAALLLVAATAAGQSEESGHGDMTTVVVPVVGSIEGINDVRWKTDVILRNDMRTEAEVALILPAAPDQPAILTTIPPGETIRFNDIVAEPFGFHAILSPLVVQTRGRRSVSVFATAYAVRGAEVFKPQPISVNYGAGDYFPMRILRGLSFSESFRTNVGLVNLGEKEARFTLALQRLPGRNIAIASVALPPSSMWHTSIQSLFPMITSEGDFSLLVESSAPGTHVYGSVIENETNTARFVTPSIGPMIQQQAARHH